MKTMPTEFRKYKADFKLMKRDGRVCLYSREAYGDTDYEVVIAQIASKDWVKDGKVLVEAGSESYPSSEQWGSQGWTYSKGCLEMAEKRFAELVALENSDGSLTEEWYLENEWPKNMRGVGIRSKKG